ncbi:MAG TPA: DUF1273 domain-containing protein [Clostridiales bacterium]|nr:DUF1273 domain-containing protein [Clostridiales bacterium]
MKICTFAGHREVYSEKIDELVSSAIEELLKTDTSFLFYTGGMGEFDKKCSSVVRAAKKQHPELLIRLVLVLPYMSNKLNTDKDYYESNFDDILIPSELADVHYKSVITERNCWMIDQSDYLIAYVRRDFGGACATMKYAKKLKKDMVNLADEEKLDADLHI